jgi:predicted enzyme related to lactoylglutathione lyase
MDDAKHGQKEDENYFCHIIIPSKDYEKSKAFLEKVFGWEVHEAVGTGSLDVLPRSFKGPSAELNSEEEVVVPVIYTSDIRAKLDLIAQSGGTILKPAAPISKDSDDGCYALFEDPEGTRMCLYSDESVKLEGCKDGEKD